MTTNWVYAVYGVLIVAGVALVATGSHWVGLLLIAVGAVQALGRLLWRSRTRGLWR